MRDIKFRAWDGEKMIIVNDIVLSGKKAKGFWKENSVIEWSETLMQYTGLKDKNGKEIYEGDVVELVGGTCDYLPNGIYNNQRYSIGDKMIVQYLKSGFTLCGLNMAMCEIPNRVGKVDNYSFWNHAQSLKVIGSIYENPELINPTG